MRGIFYNSKKAICSIWESGKMCYDALSKSENFTLDYSENQTNIDTSYDFVVYNQHFTVNNWMTSDMVKYSFKPVFCIVTEVSLVSNPISFSPTYFYKYIVLDPTVQETERIYAFGRPLEDIELPKDVQINYDIPKIGSFGFDTPGKLWHEIIRCVQNEYDNAFIHFNIPSATHIPFHAAKKLRNELYQKCKSVSTKPGIKWRITHDIMTKEQIVDFCSRNTINIFFYNRSSPVTNGKGYKAGLAAVTDQAIVSERPLLVTYDPTFRHLHPYIQFYPKVSIKQAIERSQEAVLRMKNDWSSKNFLTKFENILFNKT